MTLGAVDKRQHARPPGANLLAAKPPGAYDGPDTVSSALPGPAHFTFTPSLESDLLGFLFIEEAQ